MEPINTNTNNTEFQEVIHDQLEKVVQDFNEFQERMAQSSSSGAMKFEDLIDLYINNGGDNSYSTPQTTSLPGDLNKFESTLLPQEVQSEQVQSTHGFNINRQFQESEMMINEMTEDTSQNDTGSFPDSFQTVNINSQVGVASSSIMVTHIRYGDLNCHEAADGIIGSVFGGGSTETVFGSAMRSLRNPGAGRMNIWPEVGMKVNGNRTTREKRVKRKYRGFTETEEETAHRMEITKIMNRKAAAKAHATRQAHEAYIQASCQSFTIRKNI